MRPRHHTLRQRLLALLVSLLPLSWGACIPPAPIAPFPGFIDAGRLAWVDVPGGRVNMAGGNLLISRLDLSLDTPLGSQEIRAVYNSTTGEWLWNFQTSYDGARFVDPSGAVYDDVSVEVGLLTPGGTLPGTHWVRVDAQSIKTKGGLAYHFAATGELSHIAWATLDYPRIEFSPELISQCTQASTCVPLFELSLDGSSRPLQVIDARSGRTALFGYDALGRLETARSPFDVAHGLPGIRYEYSTGGTLLTAQVSSEGERVEYQYQASRRILHVTQAGAGNPRHRFEFYGEDETSGRWTCIHVNPLGGETRYLYDRVGRLRELERTQAGEITSIRYGAGTLPAVLRPASITTPGGATTQFSVSAEDDVTVIVEPSGNVVNVSYDAGALFMESPDTRPPRRIEDSIGLVSETAYGSEGRALQVSLPEGETASATWQGAVLETLTDPFGITTRFERYGSHGHWIDAALPSTPFPVRRAFDAVGNLLVSAAGLQDGGVLDRSYDESRQLREIHVAATTAGLVTAESFVRLARRSDGKPLSIQRPLGADHEFGYDALGRLVLVRERVDGGWHSTSFEYDAAGNVTARLRPNGMCEELGYDAYGRLTRRAALRDGLLEGEAIISWQSGRPAAFWDSKRAVTEFYSYDAAGRLAAVAWSGGESASYSYDARSRTTGVSYRVPGHSDHSVGYEYDVADRQTRVFVDGSETVAKLSYAGGKQLSVRFGNGLVRDALYDSQSGRLAGFTTRDSSSGLVETTALTRTVDSERFLTASVTTTPLGTTRENYSMGLAGLLGDVNRRVGNRVWGWDNGQGREQTYVYDELSNRTSNAEDSFVYNGEGNRLLSTSLALGASSVSYAYDDAGFVTSRNGTPIGWTATGRLASYGSVSIEWDMADRPISFAIGAQVSDLGRFGGVVEMDAQSGGIAGLDLGFARISFTSAERRFRHPDFRGNVSFVSDETGAVVAHYGYSAYGVDALLGNQADGHRFAGRLELGDELVLMGARVYDSLGGRFLSQDPVFSSLNQYAYTLGNPVDFWDADGAHQKPAVAATYFVTTLGGLIATALTFAPTLPGLLALAIAITLHGVATYNLGSALDSPGAGEVSPSCECGGGGGGGDGGSNNGGRRGKASPETLKVLSFSIGPTGAEPAAELGNPASCAPTRVAETLPDLGWALAFLIPLQLALAGLLLLRRRRGGL